MKLLDYTEGCRNERDVREAGDICRVAVSRGTARPNTEERLTAEPLFMNPGEPYHQDITYQADEGI
jgi:hypothetical protein